MNLTYTYQNAGATRPLVIPVNIVCNTDEDKILSNVLENSRRVKQWAKTLHAHDGIAVICGSSPSVADHIEQVARLQADGAHIFAMNNAANFMNDHGMLADYQVIMDAQERTKTLIGPAKAHLFASQVDPSLFELVPDAILWHSTYGNVLVDEQEGFPQHDDDYCMIGSSATVGNTSLILLYALGYRDIRVFGMDSSHRNGVSHVKHQAINDGDPCVTVNFMGREYLCSFTMKMQAENFIFRGKQLEGAGCKITVFGDGYLPAKWNAPVESLTEQQKYERMWENACYREVSPGEDIAARFIEIAHPSGTLIDFGCGTGRGGLKLHEFGCDVTLADFADNSRDIEALALPFVHIDLREEIPLSADWGYCTDVMEHIEPAHVDAAIRNIMRCIDTCFFQISLIPDSMGEIIGHQLHLSVHSRFWWAQCFKRLGFAVEHEEGDRQTAVFLISHLHEV